jgi:hypothetical protein
MDKQLILHKLQKYQTKLRNNPTNYIYQQKVTHYGHMIGGVNTDTDNWMLLDYKSTGEKYIGDNIDIRDGIYDLSTNNNNFLLFFTETIKKDGTKIYTDLRIQVNKKTKIDPQQKPISNEEKLRHNNEQSRLQNEKQTTNDTEKIYYIGTVFNNNNNNYKILHIIFPPLHHVHLRKIKFIILNMTTNKRIETESISPYLENKVISRKASTQSFDRNPITKTKKL